MIKSFHRPRRLAGQLSVAAKMAIVPTVSSSTRSNDDSKMSRSLPTVIELGRKIGSGDRLLCTRATRRSTRAAATRRAVSRRRSWLIHRHPVDHQEHQDDADVHNQPPPEVASEEPPVHDDHDRDHPDQVEEAGCL